MLAQLLFCRLRFDIQLGERLPRLQLLRVLHRLPGGSCVSPRRRVSDLSNVRPGHYEQGAPPKRIGNFVQRWQRWAVSGLGAYRNSISALAPNVCGAIA